MKLARLVMMIAVAVCGLTFASRDASAASWYNCQATDVFEYDNAGTPLLMVECSNLYTTGVNWTAVRLTGTGAVTAGQANRFAAMAQAAVLSGRKFRVFMTDTTCPNNSNCRVASSWSLYQP